MRAELVHTNVKITSRMRGRRQAQRFTDQNSLETREAILAPLREYLDSLKSLEPPQKHLYHLGAVLAGCGVSLLASQ